jgi:hypothetical protein
VTKNDSSGNNVVIAGNGKNINGTTSVAIGTQYVTYMFHYITDSNEWRRLVT